MLICMDGLEEYYISKYNETDISRCLVWRKKALVIQRLRQYDSEFNFIKFVS